MLLHRRFNACAPVFAFVLALAVAGCGTTSSGNSFKGAAHEAATAVENFQSHANSGEGSKICSEDLSASIVKRLGGDKGCEEAMKHQLAQVDNLEATVQSIKVAPGGRSATATVKGIRSGKTALTNLSLIKEGSHWRVAGP